MHTEAYTYTREALARCGGATSKAILEIGSININGSARDLCAGAAHYWGIDLVAGPGVDQVIDAAAYDGGARYDLVISNEVLEHAPLPMLVLRCAAQALRRGGYLILTCAGEGRKPHSADGSEHPHEGEHYANIDLSDLAGEVLAAGFDLINLDYLYPPGDARCIARRRALPEVIA
jgi:SAM-dependent methyltransferase